jgi:hypothetical protein
MLGIQDSFKELITKAKVSMLPLDIQRSKLSDNVVALTSPGNTCNLHGFFTIVGNISYTNVTQEGKTTHG